MTVQIPIKLKPEPYCPECGGRMVLRRPKPNTNQMWRPFWGCSSYPDCFGKRQILDNGEPETDQDIEDAAYDEEDISATAHPGHPSNYGDR